MDEFLDEMKDFMTREEKSTCKCTCKSNSTDNDTISKLESRVKFLEDEIKQKNYQLNFLMECSTVKENIEDNSFIRPKRTFKCNINNTNSNKTEIKLANRFENLKHSNETNQNDDQDDDNVIIITDNNKKKEPSSKKQKAERIWKK